RDRMAAAGGVRRLGDAAQREVVRLGAAAREHDLLRVAADEPRDRRARIVDRRFGLLTEVVNARRVAEEIAGRAGDRLRHFRGWRSRRVVVKIDTHPGSRFYHWR